MNSLDLTMHCRICMVNEEQMISIFNKSEHKISDNQQIIKISYKDMIEECASIHISTESGFPKHICVPCSILLQQCYKLRIQCDISDRILTKCLLNKNSNSSNSDIEEVMIEQHLDISDEQINQIKTSTISNQIKTSNKQIKCTLCEIIIDTEDELIKHTNEIHLKEMHKCNVCNKYYVNLSALKLHLYHHENRCKYCMKTFDNVTILNDHIQMDHEQKFEYPCTICGILCKTKTILKSHVRKHTQPEKYLCPYCGKILKDAAFLKEHLGLHTGIKPFNCKYCDLKFVFRTALYSHMVTHTKIRKYQCKICLKNFSRTQNLRRHLLTHGTERKYDCKTCGRRFKDPSDMRRHTIIHTGLKTHTCELCNMSFIRKYQLTMHLRTHTSIRPFACTECDKSFRQKHVLLSHMNKHHEKSKDS